MSEHTAPAVVDVAVIGGGAAGLAAALTLGRSRRSVLVLDAGTPRNAPADAMHAFLTRDGTPPREFLALGRAEVERYGVRVRTGPDAEVTAARRDHDGFELTVRDGSSVAARRIVLATGLTDELPDVPGLRERWGRDVIHCPYCHGYEVRDQRVGVLATGPMAAHQAKLFRQLTDDVTVLRHGAVEFEAEVREQFAALGIRVVDGPVTGVEVDDDRLTGARTASGETLALDALVVTTRMVANSALVDALGLAPVAHPMGAEFGSVVPTVDPSGRTEVPGLWVAGNASDPMAQVIAATAQGTMAGARVNADLVEEDARAAVTRQASSSASFR